MSADSWQMMPRGLAEKYAEQSSVLAALKIGAVCSSEMSINL
jgi:hypothetical protein